MPPDARRGSPALTREAVGQPERKRWLLALVMLAIVGIILRRYALEVDLLSDDYMQHAMIAGLYPGDHFAPFDLYAFVRADADLGALVDSGAVPWFAEPEFHGAVLRPLSSALLWLDHTLAPGKIRLWHAHSLAVALFVCEAGFVSPLGWLANRCVLVCAAFGFLAIYVHLEWRRPDPSTPSWLRRSGPFVELGLLAASLAGGEYALGIVAYLFAWELLVGGRDASTPADAWSVRARALVPTAVAAATYLGLHSLLDYGTFGADVYADPLHAPLGWLKWVKFRLPKLATGALWGIPAETISVFQHPGASWWQSHWPAHNAYEAHFSHMRLGLVGVGVAALGLVLARSGLHPDERRTLRALLLGACLGLLPVSVAPSHSRLLIVTQLGACATVSWLAFACVRLLRAWPLPEPVRKEPLLQRLRGAALLPIVGAMLVLNSDYDLRWSERYMVHLDGIAEADALAFTRGDLLEQRLEGRDVIVLNGPTQAVGMYGHFVLHSMGEPVPASWRSLALGGEYPVFVYRPAADTLELTLIQGAWLRTAGELFFRREDQLLPKGSRIHYPGMDIEILDDLDGRPTRARFRFPHDLDDPRYLFLTSTAAGLNRWQIPRVRGSSVVPLPRLPFPAHLFERADEPLAPPK